MTKGLILVLVLAAVMRLSFLGLIEYKADEALTVLSLTQWLEYPRVIESGLISSTGVKNFPLFQYLLLLPAVISTDPRFLSGFIGALNVATVGWFYIATRRAFGEKVALIGGLLLAVAPYPVLFSRKIWAQDLVMLFAVPIYDLLLRKKINYFWLGLLLALQAQVHGSGLFFAMAAMVWLGLQRKLAWQMIAGAAAGLVPAIPYFFSGSFSQPVTDYFIDWNHVWLPATLLSMFSWADVVGAADFAQLSSASPAVGMGMLASMVTVVGVGYGAWRHKQFAWLVGGLMLIYLVLGVPGRLHYYMVALPWIGMLAGAGLAQLFDKQPLFLKPTAGMIIAGYVLFWAMFTRYLVVREGVAGDYGVPYRYSLPRVDEAVMGYQNRNDFEQILTYAHFDPVLAKHTEGKSIHAYLSSYFLMIEEPELASREAGLAGIQ
jgi:hypothetical protein